MENSMEIIIFFFGNLPLGSCLKSNKKLVLVLGYHNFGFYSLINLLSTLPFFKVFSSNLSNIF